jgi:LysM repeat protein
MKDSADADGTSGPAVTAIKDNPKTQDSLQSPAPKKPLPKSETAKPKIIYHKVKSGETLYSISRNYGISVDTLKRLNGLRSNNIAVGRILRVQ